MCGRKLSVKTGMDGPQEGNSMQEGRKNEGRFFHYLIPKEHWPFPTDRPKWRVTAPTARHTKDVHMVRSQLMSRGSLWTRVAILYFARRQLGNTNFSCFESLQENFTLRKLGLCNTDYDCTWAGMRTSVRRSGPRPAGEK